jgi:hypothetical protein
MNFKGFFIKVKLIYINFILVKQIIKICAHNWPEIFIKAIMKPKSKQISN